ncbi:AEC family transporter [Shewanella salipaludis]|uniref:AEC family transporter n=1 Tax=Shewanella salipaludis TaxID=2723052 RepID=A0A972G230_9GAMM|nr:AEC family transporter [Shewanella salipaludis]NMH65774.1 AEC family transporter [Shewanella salipaludis]
MPAILTPLLAVVGIMLLGALIQKLRLLPADTDQVLNQYVYYVAFPAIMLIALAQTPIIEILQWGFILGYGLAMLVTYFSVFWLSLWATPGDKAIAAMRALNTSFGNTAFIGIPLLVILFPGQQSALVAAAIASLLSVLMFAVALVSVELANPKAKLAHPLMTMLNALARNPIVIGSLFGVALSALALPLPAGLALMLQQIGNTSSPCALFAIGMVLTKAMGREAQEGPEAPPAFGGRNLAELGLLNLFKLILQPALALVLLQLLGVTDAYLSMGVLLAALPTAASVYLLAQRYQVLVGTSANTILLGTLLTFISLPLLDYLLKT